MSATRTRAEKNPEVSVIYRLEGDIADIDVDELAPALMALAALVRDGNRALNADGEDVAVRVRPFRPGSFEVDIVLVAHVAMNAFQFLSDDRIKRIKDILELIGIIKSKTTSVLELLKRLRGKKATVDQIGPGEFRYQTDDFSVSVSGPVHELVQNKTVVNNIFNSYARPVLNSTATDVRSYLEGEETATSVVVTKDEARTIRGEAPSVPLLEEGPAQERRSTISVNPKRGPYGGEGGKYYFTRGEESLTATIEDRAFCERLEAGEVRFHHEDLLRIDVLESQKIDGTRVSVTHRITRVIEYVPYSPGARRS